MDFHILEGIRNAIEGLCPILGTVNLRRRVTDEGDSSNAFKAIILRAAASAIVAIVLGCASGLLSAYIMVRVMEVRVDGIETQITQETDNRKSLESRFNNHVERRTD